MAHETPTLDGLTVLSFESRRAVEIAELIRRYGGEPMSAPALREVALADNRDALEYVADLEAGKVDVVVLMTGVGLRSLAKSVEPQWPADRLAAALRRTTLVARGPKPVAALRELGLQPDVTVPEPNTWHELLATIDERLPVQGKRVAIQEYGITNRELIDGLTARGATVRRVRIYEWALPEDLSPLRKAIAALIDGKVDVALFTSATQVYHLFHVAENESPGSGEVLQKAFAKVVVGSIGPVCSEALREHRLAVDFTPPHPKMGPLVGEAARVAAMRLQSKLAAG
ncbi:MAG: uroporphyrinogen-III synthase [Deltaproteobacteria bacterium]|nr:uroporphyrinogen-III synthase [Deltaproteobacteria bacterium]